MTEKDAYTQGQHASLDGFGFQMNPFQDAALRQWWSSGWSNPMLPYADYRQAHLERKANAD